MQNKIIKLTEAQVHQLMSESFLGTGTDTAATNRNSEISAEGPSLDNPTVDPVPMTGDKYSDMRYNELYHKLNGNGLGYNSFGFSVSDFDNVLGSDNVSDEDINIEYED